MPVVARGKIGRNGVSGLRSQLWRTCKRLRLRPCREGKFEDSQFTGLPSAPRLSATPRLGMGDQLAGFAVNKAEFRFLNTGHDYEVDRIAQAEWC